MNPIKVMVNGLPGNMAAKTAEHIVKEDSFELLPFALTGPDISESGRSGRVRSGRHARGQQGGHIEGRQRGDRRGGGREASRRRDHPSHRSPAPRYVQRSASHRFAHHPEPIQRGEWTIVHERNQHVTDFDPTGIPLLPGHAPTKHLSYWIDVKIRHPMHILPTREAAVWTKPVVAWQ